MNKNNYKIQFNPKYPPYKLEDTWDIVLKMNCNIPCFIIKAQFKTKKEAERALKDMIMEENKIDNN